jgi:hypothetical protein
LIARSLARQLREETEVLRQSQSHGLRGALVLDDGAFKGFPHDYMRLLLVDSAAVSEDAVDQILLLLFFELA